MCNKLMMVLLAFMCSFGNLAYSGQSSVDIELRLLKLAFEVINESGDPKTEVANALLKMRLSHLETKITNKLNSVVEDIEYFSFWLERWKSGQMTFNPYSQSYGFVDSNGETLACCYSDEAQAMDHCESSKDWLHNKLEALAAKQAELEQINLQLVEMKDLLRAAILSAV